MYSSRSAASTRARLAAQALHDACGLRLGQLGLPELAYERLLDLHEAAGRLVDACVTGGGADPGFWPTYAAIAGELEALAAIGTGRFAELAAARALSAATRRRIAEAAMSPGLRTQLGLLVDLLDEAIERYACRLLPATEFHVIASRARVGVEDALFTLAHAAA